MTATAPPSRSRSLPLTILTTLALVASVVAVVAYDTQPAAAAAAPVIATDDLIDANTYSLAVSNNNPTAGDLLIVQIVRDSTDNVTPPTGWTLVRRDDLTYSYQAIYHRIADGTEPATTTWNFTGAEADTIIYSARITGADPTTPIADHNATITPSANNMVAPSVTVTTTDSLLMTMYDGDDCGGTTVSVLRRAWPSEPTSTRGFVTLYAAAETIATAGATGTRTGHRQTSLPRTSRASASSTRRQPHRRPPCADTDGDGLCDQRGGRRQRLRRQPGDESRARHRWRLHPQLPRQRRRW